MKDKTLREYREKVVTYVDAVDSDFKEIEKLEEELEKDPITIQIKELQDKLAKDPRTIRLAKLKEIQKRYESDKSEHGYCNYTALDYAFMANKPVIEDNETYGILLRFGPRDSSTLGRKAQVDGEIYTYEDIELLKPIDIRVEDAEDFEKGHTIIPVPRNAMEEAIRIKFLKGCVYKEPEEVAKELIKKYNTNTSSDDKE